MGKKKTFTMNYRKGGVTVNKPKPTKPNPVLDKDENKKGDK